MYQDNFSGQEPERDPNMQGLEKMAKLRAENKAKKAAKQGTVLFYSIYSACVALVVIALICVMFPLRAWLVRYEAAQPEQKAQEVFASLFENPDWASLYAQAGLADTAFEKSDAFAAYMTAKAGSTALTYAETSAGLSKDHKYIVRLGDEKIATFRLTAPDLDADIPDWELSTVELFFDRSVSVTVEKLPGQTVYINGIALNDDYTIRTITTRAEEVLPKGVSGYQAIQQCVDGLFQVPTVEIRDAAGNPVEVCQTESGIWMPKSTAAPMTEEEKALALGAAKADAKFAIEAIGRGELQQYFDSGSKLYDYIIGSDNWVQSYNSYSFNESVTKVSDFYRYSDSLYSVNVQLELRVVRSDGTKVFPINKTYFFARKSSGKFLVNQYLGGNAQERIEQIRLTFLRDGEVLGTQMVSSTTRSLTLPSITAPEGKVLQGWARRDVDEKGKVTMTILFTPGEDGKVHLAGESTLEPTALHAVFANKEAE